MDRIETWKNLLENLDSASAKVEKKSLDEVSAILQHLAPQVAPRQQKDHEACISKTEQVLGDLFDKIDFTDKPTIGALMQAMESLGCFRIAQISYAGYMPEIKKAKWYNLAPLLPHAGEIGWKSIMNFGLVKEERILFDCCLRLLAQKLQSCSVLLTLDQSNECRDIILNNGSKVAEKLFELIRDVSYDDQTMIGIDTFIFNLLMPFTNEEQQANIVKAIVQDLFKPFVLQRDLDEDTARKIYELIRDNIMDNSRYQNLLLGGLIEHMKCNILRRKRRHSIESLEEGGKVTLESVLDKINTGAKLSEILPDLAEVEVPSKSFQISYLRYWVDTVNSILSQKALAPQSSVAIMNTCIVILVIGSKLISNDLTRELSSLVSSSIENAGQKRPEKLFKSCDPILLIELTKIFSEKTEFMSSFDLSTKGLYASYFNRYLTSCIVKGDKSDADKFQQFVEFVCDKQLHKDIAQPLQYTCILELSSCLDKSKNKNNKITEVYVKCLGICARKLYKFIKRNLRSPIEGEDESSSSIVENCDEEKQNSAINGIVCIISSLIDRQDLETLDLYGDAILKLYNLALTRIGYITQVTKSGARAEVGLRSIDSSLCKLLSLYQNHRDVINRYLNYDFIDKITHLLILDESSIKLNGYSNGISPKNEKKQVYLEIKTKLDSLDERSKTFANVYQTIINNQYNNVVKLNIGSIDEFKREKSCCHGYFDQMKTLGRISAQIFGTCDAETYNVVLEKTVEQLEQLDPLNHPRFLYLTLVLESLIPRHNKDVSKDSATFHAFKTILPRISCSLIRLSKSVELGPSIHAFSAPSSHKSNKAIQCCTYSICIKIYTQMFLNYSPKFTDQFMTDAMQICIGSNLLQYAKYSSRLHRFFIQLASSIAGLLKSVCIGRKEGEVLQSSIPVFLSVFSLLIRCLILASDRMKVENTTEARENGHQGRDNPDEVLYPESVNKMYEDQLELLALDIGKTLNNLSFLRVRLVDYAPHLISSYIKDVQMASCPSSIRIHLDEGIFRIFNLVDAHQKERQDEIIEAGIQRKTVAGRARGSLFEMIHARLDQASREIFRDMHDNYNRFHRYVGKC